MFAVGGRTFEWCRLSSEFSWSRVYRKWTLCYDGELLRHFLDRVGRAGRPLSAVRKRTVEFHFEERNAESESVVNVGDRPTTVHSINVDRNPFALPYNFSHHQYYQSEDKKSPTSGQGRRQCPSGHTFTERRGRPPDDLMFLGRAEGHWRRFMPVQRTPGYPRPSP